MVNLVVFKCCRYVLTIVILPLESRQSCHDCFETKVVTIGFETKLSQIGLRECCHNWFERILSQLIWENVGLRQCSHNWFETMLSQLVWDNVVTIGLRQCCQLSQLVFMGILRDVHNSFQPVGHKAVDRRLSVSLSYVDVLQDRHALFWVGLIKKDVFLFCWVSRSIFCSLIVAFGNSNLSIIHPQTGYSIKLINLKQERKLNVLKPVLKRLYYYFLYFW